MIKIEIENAKAKELKTELEQLTDRYIRINNDLDFNYYNLPKDVLKDSFIAHCKSLYDALINFLDAGVERDYKHQDLSEKQMLIECINYGFITREEFDIILKVKNALQAQKDLELKNSFAFDEKHNMGEAFQNTCLRELFKQVCLNVNQFLQIITKIEWD